MITTGPTDLESLTYLAARELLLSRPGGTTMAFKVLALPNTSLRVLYNVSRPVGPKQSNREDDVLLVQFCLQKIFENPGVAGN